MPQNVDSLLVGAGIWLIVQLPAAVQAEPEAEALRLCAIGNLHIAPLT